MSNKRMDMVLMNTEISGTGLRRFTVRMLNSEKPMASTNEVPLLLNAIRLSRYDALSQYTLRFVEDERLYDPDHFTATLTLLCKYGIDDITQTLRMEDIVWERISTDDSGAQRIASDEAWNIRHSYEWWRTGRTVLTFTEQDIEAGDSLPSVIFRATVTIRDGLGDVIGQRNAEFEYTN